MAVPATLTFHPNFGVLTSESDIAAYKLRHAFVNPGYASTLFEKMKVSFRSLEQKHGTNPEMLANVFAEELNKVYGRYFSNVIAQVNAVVADESRGLYNLECRVVKVVDGVEVNLITSATVEYDKNNHTLNIKFRGVKK
jgi:hypothetical protein